MEQNNKEQNKIVNNELLRLEKVINIKSLKDNSVLVFRIDSLTPEIYQIIESLNYLYGSIMKEKNISYLILKNGSSLEELKEEKLNQMGWYKKGKIITLT